MKLLLLIISVLVQQVAAAQTTHVDPVEVLNRRFSDFEDSLTIAPYEKTFHLDNVSACLIMLAFRHEDESVYSSLFNRLRLLSKKHITAGTPLMLTTGMNAAQEAESNNQIASQFGFRFVGLNGCVPESGQLEGIRIFNQTTTAYFTQKQGADWEKRLYKQLYPDIRKERNKRSSKNSR